MTRVMSLSSLGGAVVMDGSTGVQAKLQLRGTGLPPVATQWFEGAGDGASFRGGRNLSRVMDVSVKVSSLIGRDAVRENMSLLGRIFDIDAGDVKLAVELDGEVWFTYVRRTGGGDFAWASDTDGKTFIKTTITVQAGDPFWTRDNAESKLIVLAGLGRGLIKTGGGSLSKLKVSTTSAFGNVEFENTGDVPVAGVWKITAPYTGFTFTSPKGEVLAWSGVKAAGYLVLDTDLGTIVDELGANQYGGLAAAPKFWAIQRGVSTAGVVIADPTSDTRVSVLWNPKRWVMF